MSEFKFACPVCGQHITADSSTSGAQLDCPTCFQKIIVPQAPREGDTKFILAATQVGKPRRASSVAGTDLRFQIRPKAYSVLPWLGILIVVAGSAAAFYHWRDVISRPKADGVVNSTTDGSPLISYPIPTNTDWTLDLAKAAVPETAPVGRINGRGFFCERATLRGGSLSLGQGQALPPGIGLTVMLFARQSEELSGRTVIVAPSRPPPVPRVIIRWLDDQNQETTREFTSGYALKIVFGRAANGRMPGQIYVGLPDDEKSFAAGIFDAEIRKQ